MASVRRLAQRRGLAVFLVGGAVRDALRRRPVRDLDFAVEGDAVGFGREWADLHGGRARAASEFRTVEVETGGPRRPVRVDFAQTRREAYARPASLPRVAPAGIGEDLARRDFTVNAMAIRLTGGAAGELLDPYRGRSDLAARKLRFLHPLSAQDDPTRAFRAARYAVRLRFSVEPGTRREIRTAIRSGAFRALSADRLRREIFLLFGEVDAAAAIRALGRLGLPPVVGAGLRADARTLARLGRLRRLADPDGPESRARTALLSWAAELFSHERAELARRLNLDRETSRLLAEEEPALALARRSLSRGGSPGLLAFACRRWPRELALAVASCVGPAAARRLLAIRSRALRLKVATSGDDLRLAGVPAGPALGRALEEMWKARFENRIARSEELAFALREATR